MEFLDKIPLDQAGLTIAMVLVVLAFAVISIIKGILKTILTLISLSFASSSFLFGFLQSPPYIKQAVPEAIDWMPLLAGGLCALLALVFIQLFFGLLTGKRKPAKKAKRSSDEESPSSKNRNPLAPIFGLLLGALALYGGLTALRYLGTNAELTYLQTLVSSNSEAAGKVPLLVQAKQWLDGSPIATWQEKIDFLNTPEYRARLNLAKLIIVSGDQKDLSLAIGENKNREAIQTPEITALALTSEDLRKLCQNHDFQALFADERFQRLTTKPSTSRALREITWDHFFPKKSE